MKQITKNDLKGLTERFPVYNENSMRKVVGGYGETDQFNGQSSGNTGTEWRWDWMNTISYSSENFYGAGFFGGSTGYAGWTRPNYGAGVYGELGSITNPYTQEQFDNCSLGTWAGGYIEGWGSVLPEVVVYGYNSGNSSGINSFHINGLNWNSEGVGINASCFK
jgi:hypothetical protein